MPGLGKQRTSRVEACANRRLAASSALCREHQALGCPPRAGTTPTAVNSADAGAHSGPCLGLQRGHAFGVAARDEWRPWPSVGTAVAGDGGQVACPSDERDPERGPLAQARRASST